MQLCLRYNLGKVRIRRSNEDTGLKFSFGFNIHQKMVKNFIQKS